MKIIYIAKKYIIVMLFSLSISGYLFCQSFSFGLEPTEQGQLSPWMQGNWNWNDTVSSELNLQSNSVVSYDEEPSDGYEKALTTLENSYRLEINPVIWKVVSNPGSHESKIEMGAGLGLHGEWWDIKETGYMDFPDPNDVSDTPATVRLFFSNNRRILAFKPALVASCTLGDTEKLNFSIDGSYMPWVGLNIKHQLSTAAAGFSEYDTPLTEEMFNNSTTHAWKVGIASYIALGMAIIDIEGILQGARYDYQTLRIGGGTDNNQVEIIDGTIRALMSLQSITVAGLLPQIGLSWNITRSRDLLSPQLPTAITSRIKLSMGFLSK